MAQADDSFEGVDKPEGSGTGDDVADAMAAIKALDSDELLGTTTEAEGKTDDTPAGATSGAKAEDGVTVEPSGVVAADGKNIIPYEVLKSTRERADTEAQGRQAAEEAARSAQEQLTAAQTELEQLRAGKDPAGAGEGAERAGSSERIAELKTKADAVREELPAMAEVIDTLVEELEGVAALKAKLEERDTAATSKRQQDEQTAQQQAAQAIRGAIDSNPTLAYWETHKDPTAYNRACDEDEMLRKDPAWAAKPIQDRFAEAVRRTELVIADAPKPPVQLSAAQIEARARKAVQDTPDFVPESLTDLPAGAPPGADPLESLANADVATLGNRVSQMSNAEIERLMARLG